MAFDPYIATSPFGYYPTGQAGVRNSSQGNGLEIGPTAEEKREAAVLRMAFGLVERHAIDPREAFTKAEVFWNIAMARAQELRSMGEISGRF